MERLAARLAVEGWRPGWIFSSPLVRARQTAEIVRDACAGALEIEALEELLPEWEPEGVLSAVEARGALEGHVLLVSHQPIAGRVVRLLTGDAPAIRPGTLVEVECEADLVPGRGRVVRVIDPEPGD